MAEADEGATEVRVPGAARLVHGESKGFLFPDPEDPTRTRDGFVVRFTEGPVDTLRAYRNWCPHMAIDLDMGTGRFYSRNVGRIYCHTHGAQFQVLTGECDYGPCMGLHLEGYALRVDGDDVLVQIPSVRGVSDNTSQRPS